MAIYHINASIVKRSAGHSAVAAAAYRAGEKLADERTGEVHDYSRRRGVNAAEILAPPDAPAWALNRETLWNRVETAERRSDSQVAREIRVAIPTELSHDAGRDLVRDYVKREFVDHGMVADVAWHDEDGPNPHSHILMTMRQIDHEDFGPKVKAWNDKKTLVGWREAWADCANRALEAHGSPERIDHRTLEAQRIDAEARGDREAALRLDRPPTMHRGKVLTHNPGAAPDRHLRFADAEAKRRMAIGLAEETIRVEARVAAGTAAHKRLALELNAAINEVIDAIPEETRDERLAHVRRPPESNPLPTPPDIEREVLVAEVARREDHRLIDAIPAETRNERLAHARQPPQSVPTPPDIEREVLVAEVADREEKRQREAERIAAAEAVRQAGADQIAAAKAADREAAHAARAAFERAAMNARDYETRDVAADLVASQPARVPWDPVEAELDRRYATDDHRYNERMDIGHGVKLDLGVRRMDLESKILEHAKSGRSRVPPARQATLGATITAVVKSIQDAADRLVNRILDEVFGRVRDPAPTAATLTAAAPPSEQPNAQGEGEARGAKTDRPSRETTREDGGHGHDASAPELPPGVRIDDKADEVPEYERGAGETRPGGAGDRRSTPKQDLNPD